MPENAQPPTEAISYREAVRLAQLHELEADDRVVLLGEDVATDGGVFKTNGGLAEQFGEARIVNTPICENGFMGAALGMAVTGLRPIVEIMFSDFLPTAGDAIVNELPKFRFMSGGQCAVPVTVRAIGGATARFGTQHSATGESWFMSFPGLRIATAGTVASAYSVLRAAIRDDNPVIFFEHRGLYGRTDVLKDESVAEVGAAATLREGSDVSVVATLLMADRAVSAADLLAAEGVSVEVIELRWLRPLDVDAIHTSAVRTKRVLVVEEQVHAGGWGATVVSELARNGSGDVQIETLSLPEDVLIPYTPQLEDELVPSVEQIAACVRQLVGVAA